MGNLANTTIRPTTTLAALIDRSPTIRRQVEDGTYSTHTPYVPTDLDYDGTEEVMAGWKETWGTCGTCLMLRSANGSCAC